MWHPARIVAAFTFIAGAALSATPCAAQSAPSSGVSLDLAALVASPDVLTDSVTDPVWSLQAQPGRRLLQVPVQVTPGNEAFELDRPPIDVRGGRFIAWRIVPPQMQPTDGRPATTQDERGWRGMLLMDNNDFDLAGQRHPAPPQRPANAPATANLPDDAPLLTRKLTVRPDGTIFWTLERAVPGATVKDATQGYPLLLRRELLAAMEPQRPGRVDVGNDLRAAQQKRREQERAYREELRAFRDLRQQVMALPTEFSVPMPPRVWAVFEVREALPELTITGPDEQSHLPWTIRFSSLQTLREVAASRGGGGAIGGDLYGKIGQLGVMARGGHPLTHRAVAMALRQANLIGRAQLNDSLYQLLQTIIQGPDAQARRAVVVDLASTVPPTAATASLLRDAADHVSPQLQLLSLRGLFQGDVTDAAQLRDMLANVNRTLTDDDGPDAGLVLEAMVEAIQPDRGGQVPNEAALITAIQFEAMSTARRDQAIAYIIRAAGTRPLAAAWLNHRLLGSTDADLAHRTLALLSRAGGSAGVMQPVARTLIALISRDASNGSDGAAAATAVTLSAPIVLDSVSHSLFRWINSGDPAVRDMAWQALAQFTLGDPARGQAEPAATGDVTAQLLTAGLTRQPVPPELATFFANSKGHPRATRGLMELVMYADPAAAGQAARALMGAQRDVAAVLRILAPGQRAEFANRLYQAQQGQAPGVVGLLADPAGNQLVEWFAKQVATGTLPEPPAWAAQYRGDEPLLQLAASTDPVLAAGAAAALVAAAGGDETDARSIAQRFAAAQDRSVAGLTAMWTPAKKEIYARRLADAAGTYRLTVSLSADTSPNPLPPPIAPPAAGNVITVGIVELTVDGQSAYLGNQTVNFSLPEDRLALRLNAKDLKNLPNDELTALPLERLTDPIDLLPQPDGSWRGQTTMPDGSPLAVTLQPVANR